MRKLFFLGILIASALAAPKQGYDQFAEAKPCNPDACKLPNCLCGSTDPPGGLNPKEIPQLVLLTFDDAVSIQNSHFYEQAFNGRKNPDGCPIGTTYFLSHDNTNYSAVHDLWARGHEIALHSITHQPPTEHWRDMTVEGHMEEFADEEVIISNFAQIPIDELKGLRIPFLQLSGDNSFEMMQKAGLKYDCSWPTQAFIDYGFWPYTLDYQSVQDCHLPPCPMSSFPGKWVVPMVDWRDLEGQSCAMVDACRIIPKETDEIVAWMIENFNRHYNGTRSPFGFFVHAAWFLQTPIHFEAYLKFIDYLQTLKEVYIVSIQRALEWVQKPSTLDNLKNSWPKCQAVRQNTCKTHTCELNKGEQEKRWMTHCKLGCPAVYPWLGNPLGEKK